MYWFWLLQPQYCKKIKILYGSLCERGASLKSNLVIHVAGNVGDCCRICRPLDSVLLVFSRQKPFWKHLHLQSSSETQGQLVGTTGFSWAKVYNKSGRAPGHLLLPIQFQKSAVKNSLWVFVFLRPRYSLRFPRLRLFIYFFFLKLS